jgi:hypothetical protein
MVQRGHLLPLPVAVLFCAWSCSLAQALGPKVLELLLLRLGALVEVLAAAA